MSRLGLCILAAALSGCAGSYVRIATMSPERLAEVSTSDLCYSFRAFEKQDERIRGELMRREAFTAREWDAIDQERIFLGMSFEAYLCSWPVPDLVNIAFSGSRLYQREGPWGDRKIYIFGETDTSRSDLPGAFPKNIFIENGVVVGYQEGTMAQADDSCSGIRTPDECFDFATVVSSTTSDALLVR